MYISYHLGVILSHHVCKRRAKVWRVAPLCLMWALWKEINERAFNERANQAIKYSFLYYFVIEDHILSLVGFI